MMLPWKNNCCAMALLIASPQTIRTSRAFTIQTSTTSLFRTSPHDSKRSIAHILRSVADPAVFEDLESNTVEHEQIGAEEPSTPTTNKITQDTKTLFEETTELIEDAQDEIPDLDAMDMTIFDVVASRLSMCLLESELQRDATINNVTKPSSVNNWISDASAYMLQQAINRVKLKLPEERSGIDRDDASAWIRWMKSSPTPLIVDFCQQIRDVANTTVSDDSLELIDMAREDFLSRLGCRLILFPSGSSLSAPLAEPPASMIYGKLLYGGITRSRILTASNGRRPPRRAGERTDVKVTPSDNIPCWIQYGGTERMYEAVDMGPAAILEVIALPKAVIARGATLTDMITSGAVGDDMVVQNFAWKPQEIFDMVLDDDTKDTSNNSLDSMDFVTGYTPISQSGKERNDAFESDFKMAVGGLGTQIDAIVRRVLDGRVIRPAQEDNNAGAQSDDTTSTALTMAAMEAEELEVLGLTPVRGLLLYGPPGTGKTLLARQIAKALRARAPKIVSAPELLDRWVGGSEKLVRGLFADAEAELAACNGDATQSALHVVVIDEIDAVFRRRSAGEDSGESTRASVVNQILAKLDGVQAINNVLLVGLTNRRELLDEALLRPGRLEVQIDVPLPDQEGRREILNIHFDALRRKGRLSKPLCCAIDGVPSNNGSLGFSKPITPDASASDSVVDIDSVTRNRKRDSFKRAVKKVWNEASSAVRPTYDLAADSATGGFSGADIAGLVRCAGSLALSRARHDGNGVDGLLITLEDVKSALEEVKP